MIKRTVLVGAMTVLLLLSCCDTPIKKVGQERQIGALQQQLLPATVRLINNYTRGSGTATCIKRRLLENGALELYFATALHVVVVPRDLHLGEIPIIGPLLGPPAPPRPRFIRPDDPKDIDAKLIFWKYNERGLSGNNESHNCTGIYVSKQLDFAILYLKIEEPTDLTLAAPTVDLATEQEYDNIKIDDKLICVGCPYGLPPVPLRGRFIRANAKHITQAGHTPLILINIDIARGVSGAAIVHEQTMKIIGIASTAWFPEGFIMGAVPIKNILEDLKETELGRKFLEESNGEKKHNERD
jgi:hypothetical protein